MDQAFTRTPPLQPLQPPCAPQLIHLFTSPVHKSSYIQNSRTVQTVLTLEIPLFSSFGRTTNKTPAMTELTAAIRGSICTRNLSSPAWVSLSRSSVSNLPSSGGGGAVVVRVAAIGEWRQDLPILAAGTKKLTASLRASKAWTPLRLGEVRVQRGKSFVRGGGLLVRAAAMAETAVGESPSTGLEQLPYKQDGYNFWTWRDHKVHYVVQGQGPPIVLIHGFGASAFHWRYNIPELAKTHTVYAVCLLGFGLSEKALIDYSADVWRDQVADFVREVVGKPAVLAGNSVGGFTVLSTAAKYPDLVSGLVLLNASGQFESSSPEAKLGDETPEKEIIETEESIVKRLLISPIKNIVQKYAILFAFWQAKQPARVKSVLLNVYKDQSNVDNYLVQSIVQPTSDPKAAEVYYRLMTRVLLKRSNQTIDKLVSQLSCPMLLLWGELDPWMGPSKCDQFKKLYPKATVVRLQAGHCPHDEAPEQVNKALLDFANSV